MSMRDLLPWTRAGLPAGRTDADPFTQLQREMNRLFDSVWRGGGMPEPFGRALSGTWPTLGLAEQDKAYVVTAELPGMEEKDVELVVENDSLVIRGEKKSDTTDEKTHVSEHFHGRFERRVPLGADVDRAAISAAFRNGVLTVTLPKSPAAAAQTRRIAIGQG